MSKKLELVNTETFGAKIKVIGVGGGGGNAVNTMIDERISGVEFITANTDAQALKSTLAKNKIQIGAGLTKGLGAGANPSVAREGALQDTQAISDALDGADMCFVTCGLGGGTGTGAAPVIAQIAKSMGILTVGVVTKPFVFEGKRRRRIAEDGLKEMRENVDTLITIPNQRLLTLANQEMTLLDAFGMVDQVLMSAVKGISDLINIHGMVNVDFADVRTVMSEMGMALMGTGEARGDKRAEIAARNAISSPLLEDISIEGATGVLINITGTSAMTLYEVNEAATLIQEAAHEEANIIFGSVIDDSLGDSIRVTVIATGFNRETAREGIELQPQSRQTSAEPLNLSAPQAEDAVPLGKPENKSGMPMFDDSKFEVPTFLRNNAD